MPLLAFESAVADGAKNIEKPKLAQECGCVRRIYSIKLSYDTYVYRDPSGPGNTMEKPNASRQTPSGPWLSPALAITLAVLSSYGLLHITAKEYIGLTKEHQKEGDLSTAILEQQGPLKQPTAF
tara:strand:+ start:98 stop:469 length:372 start_codon:yes stop_codon:yes gene_type:complete